MDAVQESDGIHEAFEDVFGRGVAIARRVAQQRTEVRRNAEATATAATGEAVTDAEIQTRQAAQQMGMMLRVEEQANSDKFPLTKSEQWWETSSDDDKLVMYAASLQAAAHDPLARETAARMEREFKDRYNVDIETLPDVDIPEQQLESIWAKERGQLREQLEEAEDYDAPHDPQTGKLKTAEHLTVFTGVEKEIEAVLLEAHLAGVARDLTELSTAGDITEATQAGAQGREQPRARENAQDLDNGQELSVGR
jgi:hypothetical protein